MISELSRADISFIWQTVHKGVEQAGSHANLFDSIELFEPSGRFKVQWPEWLFPAQQYLEAEYGEKLPDALLFSVMREIMSEHKYIAYLRRQSNIEASASRQPVVEC